MKRDQSSDDKVVRQAILFDAHLGMSRPFLIEDEKQYIKGQTLVLFIATAFAIMFATMI